MKDGKTEIVNDDITTARLSDGHCKNGRGRTRDCGSRSGGGRSCLGSALAIVGIFISLFWILNIGCGIFEIPDALPIVGNLYEAFFTMVFLVCLSYLGIEIPFISNRYIRNKK